MKRVSQMALVVKKKILPVNARDKTLDSWVWKIPWRMKWQPTLVFLFEKFQGKRSLAGYSPWGHEESDTTEELSTHT